MATIAALNLPDEVHRALCVRAAKHGRSVEAEILDILETTALPPDRVKLGTLLFNIGREIGLTDEEVAIFDNLRDKTPAKPISFDE